jgi:hypothetical protein
MADLRRADVECLERRCRRLLRAYPADYRSHRGDEIVATLLDTTPPGRRSPQLADAADVVVGGLRHRLGVASIAGFDAGLGVAAPVALALAAGISVFAWWRVEPAAVHTMGPVAYALWIIAALGRAVLPARAGRVLVGTAIAGTLVLPALSPLTGVGRPPLWILMALSAFGLLALAGTSLVHGAAAIPSTEERIGVPAGAVAIALVAADVMRAWPPTGPGFGYYYQPTIARVGPVVAAAVAVVAGIALVRLARRRPAQQWLWATALLGLPAGWLGPYDPNGVRLAADSPLPHFGRLAQVLLASCITLVAIAWLARRRTRDAPPPVPRLRSMSTAGAFTLGTGLGLVGFAVVGGLGAIGFAGLPLREGVPTHLVATLAVLAIAGSLPLRRAPALLPLLAGAGGGFVAAWLVAAYDNGWTAGGWTAYAHSMALVSTLAFVPLSICAVVAGQSLPQRGAVTVLFVAGGWIACVTVPHVLSWAPVLLVLIVCCAAAALSGRRGVRSPGAL